MKEFKSIWEQLNKLDEQAYFPMKTDLDKIRFRSHYDRHGRDLELTPEEYQDLTDALTSYPAVPLGTGKEYDIEGYVSQNQSKVKIVKLTTNLLLAAYTGDSKTGIAKTCYRIENNDFWFKANPYRKYNKEDDLRYFSDLDGGLQGLKYFKPVVGNKGLNPEKLKEYQYNLLNKIRLPIENK